MFAMALFIGMVGDDSLARLAAMPRRPNGSTVSALIAGSTGLDASATLERAEGSADHRGGAFVLRSTTLAYSFDQGVIVRLTNEIEIGGGADDRGAMFQGMLSASLMGGYRISVTPNQGPFIRGGFFGLVAGNDLFYRSALILPDAHVGYQYLVTRKILVEAAYTSGLVLTGRSDAPLGTTTDSHDLDLAVAMGALGAIHFDPFAISARWTHMFTTTSSAPVDWLDGSICAEPGKTLAICVHATWDRSDVVNITQVGLTLGTQQKKRLHSAGLY